MRLAPDLPSTYEIAQQFIYAVRAHLNIQPEVKWLTDAEPDTLHPWELCDHIFPDQVSLTWDEFIALASAALDRPEVTPHCGTGGRSR